MLITFSIPYPKYILTYITKRPNVCISLLVVTISNIDCYIGSDSHVNKHIAFQARDPSSMPDLHLSVFQAKCRFNFIFTYVFYHEQ